MTQSVLTGAEPLYLKGKKPYAFLFIHGFKATAYELKSFAEFIHKTYNATVAVPLLSGHGITPDTLNASKWSEWAETARTEYIKLDLEYDEVFVVGMSMGGSLALYLATEFSPKALVCIGTPVVLKKRTLFAYFLQFFKRYWDDSSGPDVADKEAAKLVVRLDKVPIKALLELHRFLSHLRSRLHLVKAPLLLCHSKNDHVIRYHNMESIQKRVSSNHIEMETYTRSFHIIPLDYDRQDLYRRSKHYFDQFITS